MGRRIIVSNNIKSNNKKYKTKNLHQGVKKGFYRHVRRPCPHCGKIVLLYPIITDGMVNTRNDDVAYETNGSKHNCIPKVKIFKKKGAYQGMTKEKAQNTLVEIDKYSRKSFRIKIGEMKNLPTEKFIKAYTYSEGEIQKAIEFLYFEIFDLETKRPL